MLLLPILLALIPGCALLGRSAPPPIGEIHLFGLPTALTLPGSSLPAGVGVRIYASETNGSRGLPVQDGRLDVLLFDQSAVGLNPQTQKPLKVWSFQAADLAVFRSATMVGMCYQLELRWGPDRPKGKVATVVARYSGSDKSEIYSTATSIALTTL
jgi:hypothetical protein